MTIFKRSLAIGAAAAAIAFAGGAAQATAFTTPLLFSGGTYSGNFGNTVGAGTFNDSFTFSLPSLGGTSVFSLTSATATPTSFIGGFSGYLDTNTAANEFTILPFYPFLQFGALAEPTLTSGSHTLYLTGTTTGAAYSGSLSIAAAAVPETATWAMMIAGVGFVGGAMRRRAVRTSVSFA